jgi:hypothetical protein
MNLLLYVSAQFKLSLRYTPYVCCSIVERICDADPAREESECDPEQKNHAMS